MTTSPCSPPISLRLILALLFLVLWVAPGVDLHAQTVDPGQSASVNPLLDPTPVTVESLNLRFHPPRGANTIAENLNGSLVVTLSDNPKTPTWTMRVQALRSTIPEPTAKGQIDDLLKEFDRSKSQYRIVSNEPHTAGGIVGQLCYLERTTKEGQNVVTGWLVLPIAKSDFMVFAMQTVPESFPLLRGVWEASFATLDLRTQEQVSASRLERLKRGADFLAGLKPEQLQALASQNNSQWSRIYKPSGGGGPATEIGCAMVEITAGKRGALNPEKKEDKYNAAERAEGLMVRIQGRYVVDAAKKIFYDTIALYWVAWDQSDEAWSVRSTQRQGDTEVSEAETGLRAAPTTGQPAPVLSVIKTTTTAEPVSNQWDVPEVYMSQALGWIIGKLLPRDAKANEPQDYAWYYYVASSMKPKVYQRMDKWEHTSDGAFVLTTYLSPETPPYTSTFDKDGNLIRRVHGDGSVTEPIDLEELRKIWKARGLPVAANQP